MRVDLKRKIIESANPLTDSVTPEEPATKKAKTSNDNSNNDKIEPPEDKMKVD